MSNLFHAIIRFCHPRAGGDPYSRVGVFEDKKVDLKNTYFLLLISNFTGIWIPACAGMTSCKNYRRKAFTLVELSIVIVIMGLLVAATMSGGELLKIAKLKSVISEIESYRIAVNNFKVQYEALPGDIKNASSFWADAANGNGNGKIGNDLITDFTEPLYVWQHLSLSKLIPGTYSGTGSDVTIGTNVPASKYIEGSGFMIFYNSGPWNYADALGRLLAANYITFGRYSCCGFSDLPGSVLTPTDAMYIDTKVDDGTPDFGKIVAGTRGADNLCTTGSAPNILYDATLSVVGCEMMISIE